MNNYVTIVCLNDDTLVSIPARYVEQLRQWLHFRTSRWFTYTNAQLLLQLPGAFVVKGTTSSDARYLAAS